MPPEPTHVSPNSRRLFARWEQHLADRRTDTPDKEDFLAFGKLSTLERLQQALEVAAAALAKEVRAADFHPDQRRKKASAASPSAKPGRCSDGSGRPVVTVRSRQARPPAIGRPDRAQGREDV